MKRFLTLAVIGASSMFVSGLTVRGQDTTPPKYNVLFIMSDDMRQELGAAGGIAKTPNLDKLASQGVDFTRTYCQYPLCNPSRSSMLTGRDVASTGVLGNRAAFFELHPDLVSLPKYFQQNHYVTVRNGKIFHGGIDDASAWTVGGAPAGVDFEEGQPGVPSTLPAGGTKPAKLPSDRDPALGATRARHSDQRIVFPGNGEDNGDYKDASRTIEALNKYKNQAFFIACGFSKPHSPPGAPQSDYDKYPLDSIQLPVDFEPRPTVPPGFPPHSIRARNADLFIGRDATELEAKQVIQSYLASISFVDDNVGRVLAELDRLGIRDKTIVVFTVDHGYQLGEKGKWSKAGSLFEEGDRIPLIIDVPGNAGNGKACDRIVEAVDLYPTLVELCRLPLPEGQQGRSLVPLVKDPTGEWDHPAFSVWSEDGKTFTGTAVRTEKWRYAEFDQGRGGAMLFDMKTDPHQLKNLVNDPANADVVAKLSELVREHNAKWAPNGPQSPLNLQLTATTKPAA